MIDHLRLAEIVEDFRAGGAPASGTTSYAAGDPTRTYFHVFPIRDGSIEAREESVEFLHRLRDRYGRGTPSGDSRWSYEIPPQVSRVLMLDETEVVRAAADGAGSHLAAYASPMSRSRAAAPPDPPPRLARPTTRTPRARRAT